MVVNDGDKNSICGSNTWFLLAVSILIFAVPAFSVVVDHGASAPFTFLLLLSFACLPRALKGPVLQPHEKWLLWLLFAYFAAVSLSWALADFNDGGLMHVGRAARFAVAIPIYLMLRQMELDMRWLAYGLMFGAIVAGLWALQQRFIGLADRASGATHPILFGDLALIMGVMAISMRGLSSSRLYQMLSVIALVMGMLASLLSASRGGWIALPALVAIMIWFCWGSISLRNRVLVIATVIVVPLLLYLLPSTGVQQRFAEAVQDVQRYTQGDSMNNSIGERLAMWKAGWLIFIESPVTGAGVGNFIPEAHQLMYQHKVGNFNLLHYHAHNIYVTVVAQQGLIGLSLMLLLLLYPLYMCVGSIRSDDVAERSMALAGICLVVSYMHFGLSEAVFTRSLTTIFYVFCIIALLAGIAARRLDLHVKPNAS